jgi:pyruvate kinase
MAAIPSQGLCADLHSYDESSHRLHQSFLAKLEAIASSAVRAAEKADAKLLIVFTDTGLTASLVAKYRPSVPILTLVVPRLVNENMCWRVLGRGVARQCQIIRGLVPMLAAPSQDGERVLRDTIAAAADRGLLKAGDHAVCVEKISGDYCIKMVSVDESGRDLLKQSLQVHEASAKPMLVTSI